MSFHFQFFTHNGNRPTIHEMDDKKKGSVLAVTLALGVATVRLFFLVAFDGQTLQHGFFYGWDSCTLLVAGTHMLKAWSTLYLLVYLDSVPWPWIPWLRGETQAAAALSESSQLCICCCSVLEVLKNMGESLAVLATYLLEIALPICDASFEIRTLLAVLVVMLSLGVEVSFTSGVFFWIRITHNHST